MISTVKSIYKKNFNFLHQITTGYGVIGINILVFAFLTPFMLNHLGKEQYGIWQLVNNIAMYFSMSSLGLSSAFYLEFSKHKNDQYMVQKLVNTIFFGYLFVSIVSFIIFIFILIQFDSLFIISKELIWESKCTFLISYLAFLVVFIFGFLDYMIYINHKITTRNITDIFKICLNGLGSILLIYLGYNIVAVAMLSLIANSGQMIFYYFVSKKYQTFNIRYSDFDFSYLKSLYKNGVYFFVYTVSTLVIMNTDNILISHLMGTAFVSIYAIIFRFVTISERFIFVITSVKGSKVSQFVSQQNYEAVYDMYKKVWLVTLGLSIGVAIFLSVFGMYILEIWLGKSADYDIVLIYIFSIFIVIHSLSSCTAWFMGNLNVIKVHSMVCVFEILANLGLSVLLFQYYGLRGIALGTVISHILVGSWFPTIYLVRHLKNKIQIL